jgi:hypothetical protein
VIIFTYIQINYKYIPNFKYIQVHSNTFKYIKILWNIPWIHYKYIWNTLKYILNTSKYTMNVLLVHVKYIQIYSNIFKYTRILSDILKYIEIYYKSIESHWNILPIQWSTVQIHPNALKNIQILGVFKNTSIYHYKYILIF